MRNFLKIVAVALAAIAAFVFTPTPVADAQFLPENATYYANSVTALDTSPMLAVKFVGSDALATVTVTATALTFTVGGAAYTGFECPVVAPLGGIIDTTNAACNEVGEVIDTINSDINGKFKAVALNALRTSDTNNSMLADAEDTDVKTPAGEVVYWDQSDNDDGEVPMWTNYNLPANQGIQPWLPNGATQVNPNPFKNTYTTLSIASINTTNAGTIENIEVHCVVENYNSRGNSSEVDSILFLEAGAATGTVDLIGNEVYSGYTCQGGKMFIRALASGADSTAMTFVAYGYQTKIGND